METRVLGFQPARRWPLGQRTSPRTLLAERRRGGYVDGTYFDSGLPERQQFEVMFHPVFRTGQSAERPVRFTMPMITILAHRGCISV